MKMQQSGFTLIELVVVIVILGILAATALPKFVDLSTDAGKAAASGVAGAIASGTAVNYAAQAVKGSPYTGTTTGLNVANVCAGTAVTTSLQALVTGVTLAVAAGNSANSTTYNIQGTGDCSGANAAGTAVTCTVQGQYGVAVNASVICGKA